MPRRKTSGGRLVGRRLLYDVLGVPETATQIEIQRAYKVRALQVHPDKNPGSAGAKEAFQQLCNAYETLSDPTKRRQYDELGIAGDADGIDAAEAMQELIRTHFRKVTPGDIVEFERCYKGSEEERSDVATFVRSRKGDVSQLLEHIVCIRPDEVDRFLTLIQELLDSGDLAAGLRRAVERTTPALRKAAVAHTRRSKAEARELQAVAGGDARATLSLEGLALAIQERQAARGAALTEALEAKYGGAGGSAAKKRPAAAAPPPRGAKAAKKGAACRN